jgi:uncharacterized coiled-coil protein SlyX
MAVTVKQLLDSIYRRIGTNTADAEYPREQLLTYLNDAIAEAWQDCARLAPDVLLTVGRTLTKTAEPNAYALAQQSPPILAVEQVRRVRCDDHELTCVPYADLASRDQYALTGVSTSMLLLTDARGTLVMDYTASAPLVAQDGDEMPTFIPDQFRAVLEYMVVREAMAQGNEAEMPPDYRARFEERRDMLWEHWANRSSNGRVRRDLKARA